MLRSLLLALLLLPFSVARAQSPEAPLLETRAVWFATVLQDGGWPVTGTDPDSQAEALRERIRTARALGMNTFIFQAVARGDALYPSTLLPWSPVAKGPGEDPGYDPLAVAVDEAHAQGMELHAWINTFRVGDTTTEDRFRGVSDPEHVIFAHPEWTDSPPGGEDIWLDPSSEDARAWLVDVVMEIVENYAVDAVHFDFIRYPQFGLEDDASRFAFDPRGFSDIDDWRRDNITLFVRDVADAVLRAKPWMKLGATPIGNYRDNGQWPALFAFSDVYQESRRWVQEGLLDYLAPQIYFSIGTAPEGDNSAPSPDFEFLIEEWEAESAGRAIFAGIGAYKPDEDRFPADDLPRQIDSSRTA
ncbi:MAG: family 10 glycosylhydrolase, partial [Bacteroidetes bacterium]|nr:family 10 glycosylhydrolase [Bacteroidota bacterium]